MHNHNHFECIHMVRHCKHCDVTYCINCNRQWGYPRGTIYWNNPYSWGSGTLWRSHQIAGTSLPLQGTATTNTSSHSHNHSE